MENWQRRRKDEGILGAEASLVNAVTEDAQMRAQFSRPSGAVPEGALATLARIFNPSIDALEENWYGSVESVAEASVEDLVAIGLPRWLAKELANASVEFDATEHRNSRPEGRASKGGKSKGKRRL